jgi:hypothetical protein
MAQSPGIEPLVVPLGSKRRERTAAIQKFNHVIPAGALLAEAMNGFRAGVHGFALWLAIIETVAGALFIISMARGVRRAMREQRHGAPGHSVPHAHGIDWPDVFAAGVLAAEALEKWHTRHHLARPTILTAAITLMLGLFQGRLITLMEHRRALRVNEAGISVGARPFRRGLTASWPEVASVDVGERYATIRTRAGRERRIDLSDVREPGRVRDALAEAQRRLASRSALPELPTP